MMDPKMAIHVLQCGSWWDSLLDDISDADMNPLQDALDAAIDALEKECQKYICPIYHQQRLTESELWPIMSWQNIFAGLPIAVSVITVITAMATTGI